MGHCLPRNLADASCRIWRERAALVTIHRPLEGSSGSKYYYSIGSVFKVYCGPESPERSALITEKLRNYDFYTSEVIGL